MYFMSTACGRPQGGGGGQSHVDARVRGVKNLIFLWSWLMDDLVYKPEQRSGTYYLLGAFRYFMIYAYTTAAPLSCASGTFCCPLEDCHSATPRLFCCWPC